MSETQTYVKINGDAVGLKEAATQAKVAIANLRNTSNESSVSVREFFRSMHAGMLTAEGSMRGMGRAFSAVGPMIPIVAAGFFIRELGKLEFTKKLIGDITDTLGFTTKAFDLETKAIEAQNKEVIKAAQFERDLAKAKGDTHDQDLGYVRQIENLKITQANAEIKRIKEQDLVHKASLKIVLANAILGVGATRDANIWKAASDKQYSDKTLDLVHKQGEIIIDAQNAIKIATATTNREDEKDFIKTLQNEAKEGERVGREMENMIKESQKREEEIKRQAFKKEKDDAESYYKWLHEKVSESEKDIIESQKIHKDKIKGAYDAERDAINGVAGAFSALISNGKNGWKELGKYMTSYFEEMIAKVLASIAVWTVLDALSLGTGAGGKVAISLGDTIKGALGLEKFASGTNFAPGGLALVGERGPELVNLPRGSQVIPNAGSQTIKVIVEGKTRGHDIYWTGQRYGNLLSQNT